MIDLYDVDRFEPSFYRPQLAKYKDIHKGKRMFLVGNGPSVRLEDLETLHRHGELSFGVKQVYKIFDKTVWRPTYLAMGEVRALMDCWEDRPSIPCKIFMAAPFDSYSWAYSDLAIPQPKEFSNV